jgi:hypothetical protein
MNVINNNAINLINNNCKQENGFQWIENEWIISNKYWVINSIKCLKP